MNHDMIEFLSRLSQFAQTLEGWDWEVKLTPRQKRAVNMLRKDLQDCYVELIESLSDDTSARKTGKEGSP